MLYIINSYILVSLSKAGDSIADIKTVVHLFCTNFQLLFFLPSRKPGREHLLRMLCMFVSMHFACIFDTVAHAQGIEFKQILYSSISESIVQGSYRAPKTLSMGPQDENVSIIRLRCYLPFSL